MFPQWVEWSERDMTFLDIIPWGCPLLRRQSERFDYIDGEITNLVRDMTETMRTANGVGLAAPQVGVSKMLFLIDMDQIDGEETGIEVVINPETLSVGEERVSAQEGCLSLPEVWADVERPERVNVRYMTAGGKTVERELTGLPARVFQHEYDHLIGVLFIDRISLSARMQLKGKLQAIVDGTVKPFRATQVDIDATRVV